MQCKSKQNIVPKYNLLLLNILILNTFQFSIFFFLEVFFKTLKLFIYLFLYYVRWSEKYGFIIIINVHKTHVQRQETIIWFCCLVHLGLISLSLFKTLPVIVTEYRKQPSRVTHLGIKMHGCQININNTNRVGVSIR